MKLSEYLDKRIKEENKEIRRRQRHWEYLRYGRNEAMKNAFQEIKKAIRKGEITEL